MGDIVQLRAELEAVEAALREGPASDGLIRVMVGSVDRMYSPAELQRRRAWLIEAIAAASGMAARRTKARF